MLIDKLNTTPGAQKQLMDFLVGIGLRPDGHGDARTFETQLGTVVETGARYSAAMTTIADARGALGQFLDEAAECRGDAGARLLAADRILRELGFKSE
jgi:hypothetical protein